MTSVVLKHLSSIKPDTFNAYDGFLGFDLCIKYERPAWSTNLHTLLIVSGNFVAYICLSSAIYKYRCSRLYSIVAAIYGGIIRLQ
jgi:hypothetical protein